MFAFTLGGDRDISIINKFLEASTPLEKIIRHGQLGCEVSVAHQADMWGGLAYDVALTGVSTFDSIRQSSCSLGVRTEYAIIASLRKGTMGVVARLKHGREFIQSTIAELHWVSWPNREQTIRLTLIVVGVSVGLGALLASIDYGLSQILKVLIK